MNETVFLDALHAGPNDEVTWLALADWLEENGQNDRAEFVRIVRQLRAHLPRRERPRLALEARLFALLAKGVRPCVPEVVTSIGMRLVLIPPGVFRMGSSHREPRRFGDEGPAHDVEITRPYYLGVFPVTQAQYQQVMSRNPSDFSADGRRREVVATLDTQSFPVENVSRTNAVAFCNRLSGRAAEKKAKRKYRLPTEAEWEYACRAGTTAIFAFGNSLTSHQANFNGANPYGNSATGPALQRTCTVGSYAPNAFGLYDMHGQVWEWCSDWFDYDYYQVSPRVDPSGPASPPIEPEDIPPEADGVLRGGCWTCGGDNCRSAIRYRHAVDRADPYYGFRVACEAG